MADVVVEDSFSPKLERMLASSAGIAITLYRCRDGSWRVRVDTPNDRLYMRAYPALVQMAGRVIRDVVMPSKRASMS